MFRRLMRHIREGFIDVKRNSAMSFSSAAAVTLTLLLVSVFLILTVNLQEISNNISDNLLIHVKIKNEVTDEQAIQSLQTKIEALENVSSVTFSSREEELEKQLEAFPALGEVLKIRDENPLRNAFIVRVNQREKINETASAIASYEEVEETEFGGEGVMKLISMLGAIQQGGLILVLGLSTLAIFLIANTIKVTIYARKEEISIMRTVGASNGFIRAPFLVEGMVIGFLGGIIPVLSSVIFYHYIYNRFGGFFFSTIFKLAPTMPFMLYLSLALFGIGMLVGFIGSFISVTRYLRWKR